jgi:DNA-binding LytR/AlgR family response regulator
MQQPPFLLSVSQLIRQQHVQLSNIMLDCMIDPEFVLDLSKWQIDFRVAAHPLGGGFLPHTGSSLPLMETLLRAERPRAMMQTSYENRLGGVRLKLRIEVSDGLPESEVIIRCGRVDDAVQKLQAYILSLSAPKLVFYKGQQEFYLALEGILFFETDGDQVYAHTPADAFRVKHRLYELETILPRAFVRASKATIVNTQQIYAISRDLTSSSQVRFAGTHKQVYISRRYYKELKDRMDERRV